MRFQCSHCDHILSVDDDDMGSFITCGSCKNMESVPTSLFEPRVVISDYIIVKKIGVGRTATVYLAHQISLDRKVALKILEQELADESDFILDFFREAKTAGKLTHPNIVQVYAVDEEKSTYFIAMEYIENRNLKQIIEEDGHLPLESALRVLHQIAEALVFIWNDHKLLHENIKPENILITPNNIAKLCDLGLSRSLKNRESTSAYVSPEKILGSKIDGRSDLYSLGVTFYEMLTGRPPFEAANDEELRQMHLKENPIPAQKLRKGIPDSYLRIIDKLLAKHPDDRYTDAVALINDIKLARDSRKSVQKVRNKMKVEKSINQGFRDLKKYLMYSLIANLVLLVTILAVIRKNEIGKTDKEKILSEMEVYHNLAIEMNAPALKMERANSLLSEVTNFLSRYPQSPHNKIVKLWKNSLEEYIIQLKRNEDHHKYIKEENEAKRLIKIVDDTKSSSTTK